MQQTIHGDCRELATFVCKYLSVCLHNPFSRKLSTVFITLTESMNKINCFLAIALPSGKVVQVSPFFASVLCQIKLNTLKLHSIQNNTFCVYCNFSVLEAVTNFSFIAVYSLPCSSALFLVSPSYIGSGSSNSISKTYAAKIFFFYKFKIFFNLPFAFEA